MLTTKRYDYIAFDAIQEHPSIANHRGLNREKVEHYTEDILKNGLLEPLIVWERRGGEFYLVGGFHRLNAIRAIRNRYPGYFDRVDVRVVDGDLDEMRALNLKLNADRLDTHITDYFDTIIHLNNANWSKEKIAEFLDRGVSWVEDIVRYVPGMDPRVRALLTIGKLSWNKAKIVCRKVLDAEPGTEKAVLDQALAEIDGESSAAKPRRVLTLHSATRRLAKQLEGKARPQYTVSAEDLLALFSVIGGKGYSDDQLARVRHSFPGLLAE